MCLTTEALVLFLNMIGMDIVSTTPTAIVVHASSGDVAWHQVVDQWCTSAPHHGRTAPFLITQPS